MSYTPDYGQTWVNYTNPYASDWITQQTFNPNWKEDWMAAGGGWNNLSNVYKPDVPGLLQAALDKRFAEANPTTMEYSPQAQFRSDGSLYAGNANDYMIQDSKKIVDPWLQGYLNEANGTPFYNGSLQDMTMNTAGGMNFTAMTPEEAQKAYQANLEESQMRDMGFHGQEMTLLSTALSGGMLFAAPTIGAMASSIGSYAPAAIQPIVTSAASGLMNSVPGAILSGVTGGGWEGLGTSLLKGGITAGATAGINSGIDSMFNGGYQLPDIPDYSLPEPSVFGEGTTYNHNPTLDLTQGFDPQLPVDMGTLTLPINAPQSAAQTAAEAAAKPLVKYGVNSLLNSGGSSSQAPASQGYKIPAVTNSNKFVYTAPKALPWQTYDSTPKYNTQVTNPFFSMEDKPEDENSLYGWGKNTAQFFSPGDYA